MASQASQQIEPPPPPNTAHIHREPKLIPLSPDDDSEHYLTTFEKMATVCRWPKEEWAIRLIPLLTGKANSAYVLMDISDAEDYEKVKEVIWLKIKSRLTPTDEDFVHWTSIRAKPHLYCMSV